MGCRTFRSSVLGATIHEVDVEFSANGSDRNLVWDSYSQIHKTTIQQLRVDEGTSQTNISCEEKLVEVSSLTPIRCASQNCRACILAKTLGCLDALLASNMARMAENGRSLTLRGEFGQRTKFMHSVPGSLHHSFLGKGGLTALSPRKFEFNMCWKFWDIAILDMLSLSQLVILKLPVGMSSDCEPLGHAIASMTRLKSLTITDVPDDDDFLDELPFLGHGILLRGQTLRELDLCVTNYNRPDYYCKTWMAINLDEEPIVGPSTWDRHFNAFFAGVSDDESEGIRDRFQDFTQSITKDLGLSLQPHPLKLERLRLRHIDIPDFAFTQFIDGTNLKELRLTDCDVHCAVWSSIGTESLSILEDLDYDLYPYAKDFLHSQPLLQSLSFRRPIDTWEANQLSWYDGDEAPTLHMSVRQAQAPLGQATAWCKDSSCSRPDEPEFPRLDGLLKSLSYANIRYLHLPADMYDITADTMYDFGIQLPCLEGLTFGFDYEDAVSFGFASCVSCRNR